MEKAKFCPALWFSGFFGLGALAHLVRVALGFSLAVGGYEIPMMLSAVAAGGLGVLSVGLLVLSLKRPCEKKGEKTGAGCCH